MRVVVGCLRSLVLVVLTWVVPASWVVAGVWFLRVFGSVAAAAGCLLGVVVVSLVVCARPLCGAVRVLVTRWTGTEIRAAYRPAVPVTRMATGYWWNGYDYQRWRWVSAGRRWLHARTRDPAAWRDMLWVVVSPLTVGVAGVVLLPVGWRLVTPMARMLLGPSVSLLSSRIASLVQGRADLTQAQDAELHRIERNLHDGAQARLVSIGLSLGAAERLIDTDPGAAKVVLRQARETSLTALRELRELVHGIVPPVLLERGFVDAVRALAVNAPVPVTLRSDVDGRLETPIEAALYFATAELLANAVKHAGGSGVEITVSRTRTGVAVVVADDGCGGAVVGSGLAGVRARLAAFDGVLRVDSPAGGPTVVTVEVPCGSS